MIRLNTQALDGSLSTGKIADLAVTAAKLADNAVTTAKILDANVTTAKIADANVTTVKIADDAITNAKVAANAITNAEVDAAAAIAESKIAFAASGGHNHNGTNSTNITAIGGFDVTREVPAGTVNGTNKAFTLASTPSPAASELLFLNGVLLRAVATASASDEYTISGVNVTLGVAPLAGDDLRACYAT